MAWLLGEQMAELVHVRRQPNDHRTAAYRLEDVEAKGFDTVSGGVHQAMPRPVLCGYVWCDKMVEGELAHSCQHGAGPHRIKVVISKSCNDPKLWAKLAGEECREPKPLDMSPDAVAKRRERALKSTKTRAANRLAKIEALVAEISKRWPTGRLPAAHALSTLFNISKSEAAEARRRVVAMRASSGSRSETKEA